MGGGETAMIAAAEALRRHFAVSICVLARRPPTAFIPAGTPPHPAGTNGNGGPPDLRRELQARFGAVAAAATVAEIQAALAPVDAVIWYGLNALTPTALAGMPRRPRSLRVVHTVKDEEVEHHLRWRHVIDAVCCVSPTMQRRIEGAAFVPNTCSPDRLRGRRRRLFPAPPTAPASPTLGYAGRLLPFKNVSWLVERLDDLGCNLVVQGIDTDDLTAAHLAALAAERGTARRLRFLPPATAVGTLMRSVDAMVVLSLHEAFPMTVVEAGLAGTPVIATRTGVLPHLFAGEILFVESAAGEPDAASFRRALAALAPEWGRRLRRKVEPLCSPAAVAAAYAARLSELLRGT